jgi:hypothetical protein
MMRAAIADFKLTLVLSALAVTAFCHTLLFIALSR